MIVGFYFSYKPSDEASHRHVARSSICVLGSIAAEAVPNLTKLNHRDRVGHTFSITKIKIEFVPRFRNKI